MKETFTLGFREVGIWNVEFNPSSQRFFYGSADVSALLSREQKVAVGGASFDVEYANRQASDAARDAAGLPHHSDGQPFSWWDVAADTAGGVGSDVASASESVREVFGVGVENAGKFKTFLTLATVGLLAFALWRASVFKR